MSVLSNGPFSYNRFDKTTSGGGLGDAYSAIYEKKADKDHDGDGKVESSKEEYFGSKDKAIKKAMGKDTKSESKGSEGDCGCSDKKDKSMKEQVIDYLVQEGFANNIVSAEVIIEHATDSWLEEIMEGMMPLPKAKMARQADKAYGKEQRAVAAGDEAGANKQMQRRIAMNDPAGRKTILSKSKG